MDLPLNSEEVKRPTFTLRLLRALFRTVFTLFCLITIAAGVLFGYLGWKDYVDAPHGGYTLIVNSDGSDSGYLNPKTGQFTAGVPPSRVRDFIEQAKRLLKMGPDQSVNRPSAVERNVPDAHAISSNQRPAHAGVISTDMLGKYTSGDYELTVSQSADSAKGKVHLSLAAHNTEVWTATAARSGDEFRFYKDQTHDCPLLISRLTGRLAWRIQPVDATD